MIHLQSPFVSTQMGGITGSYKILILSTQVKQGKVHRILITPLQSHSKLHWKLPVFSLQCFHWNGWNHRGLIFLILPLSFTTHWDGREIEKTLELVWSELNACWTCGQAKCFQIFLSFIYLGFFWLSFLFFPFLDWHYHSCIKLKAKYDCIDRQCRCTLFHFKILSLSPNFHKVAVSVELYVIWECFFSGIIFDFIMLNQLIFLLLFVDKDHIY